MSSSSIAMRLTGQYRNSMSSLSRNRQLHTSVRVLQEQQQHSEEVELENFEDDDVVTAFMNSKDTGKIDTTSAGHLAMRRDRQILYYLRLIENELPDLVALRRPFVPPTSATPLVVRSVDYAGEEHPATTKRTIVVPIAQLPLKGEDAIHKFKILAGVRWTPEPPKDAGIGPTESGREHGYIKISSEDFPHPAQNLKWASDVIDQLIEQSNDATDSFKDVPHDTRHLVAKARKAKKGEHISGRIFHRPSIKDFPKEWLPEPQEQLGVPALNGAESMAVTQ